MGWCGVGTLWPVVSGGVLGIREPRNSPTPGCRQRPPRRCGGTHVSERKDKLAGSALRVSGHASYCVMRQRIEFGSQGNKRLHGNRLSWRWWPPNLVSRHHGSCEAHRRSKPHPWLPAEPQRQTHQHRRGASKCVARGRRKEMANPRRLRQSRRVSHLVFFRPPQPPHSLPSTFVEPSWPGSLDSFGSLPSPKLERSLRRSLQQMADWFWHWMICSPTPGFVPLFAPPLL